MCLGSSARQSTCLVSKSSGVQIPPEALYLKHLLPILMMLIRQASINIHNFKVRLKGAERRLHNPLSERNRALIAEFEKKLLSEGLSSVRVEKYVEVLRKIGELLGKDFDAATKSDIEGSYV